MGDDVQSKSIRQRTSIVSFSCFLQGISTHDLRAKASSWNFKLEFVNCCQYAVKTVALFFEAVHALNMCVNVNFSLKKRVCLFHNSFCSFSLVHLLNELLMHIKYFSRKSRKECGKQSEIKQWKWQHGMRMHKRVEIKAYRFLWFGLLNNKKCCQVVCF